MLEDAEGAQRGEDTADAAPVLRLYVPGTEVARVTLGITTADGGGTTVDATAEPGVVTDVPLDDFPDGRYSFTIDSSVPIVAGGTHDDPDRRRADRPRLVRVGRAALRHHGHGGRRRLRRSPEPRQPDAARRDRDGPVR
ncbi:DUF5719 family protein [Curtobacterium sp. MCPF17_052]|uniref:DUF5719 family protein n=1 Tax=Curtobacterium sp. MCPF17_052 TaxID=2175655 RepID=UPI003463EEAB